MIPWNEFNEREKNRWYVNVSLRFLESNRDKIKIKKRLPS